MRKIFTAVFVILFGVVLLIGLSKSIPLTEYENKLDNEKSGSRYVAKNV